MPRPSGSDGRASASTVLRTLGLIIGGLLAATSAWIIVTGDTTKRVQIGVLVGLWGLLIVAYAAFGTRRHDHELDPVSTELMLRASGGVDRMQSAAAMREYEQSLRALLRREIQEAFQVELASLRGEVAALRSEVVEKVGGQLRLERIETTRVIGSDIEALQHEVRQLGMSRRVEDIPQPPPMPQPAPMRPAATVDAEVIDVTQGIVREPVRPVQQPVQQPAPVPIPEPVPVFVPPPVVEPEPVPEPLPSLPPLGAATVNDDPFASLPRIRPFTEFELEPSRSVGISIFDEPEPGTVPVTAGGRHSSDVAAEAHPSGGRRRRESDDDNNVLSQILQREGRKLQS